MSFIYIEFSALNAEDQRYYRQRFKSSENTRYIFQFVRDTGNNLLFRPIVNWNIIGLKIEANHLNSSRIISEYSSTEFIVNKNWKHAGKKWIEDFEIKYTILILIAWYFTTCLHYYECDGENEGTQNFKKKFDPFL